MATPEGYVAYIDEAGDDGLRNIRTATNRGASQWLVMSAVVVKSERDAEIAPWLRAIVQSLEQAQITHLHFRRSKDEKKILVCEQVAALPLRIFAVISHKKNMEGHINLRAEQAKINRTAWFYCWMSRLLLERVTAYCGSRCFKDYGEPRTVRIEFSDRGGVRIDDVVLYYKYLSDQSRMGMLYNSAFDLDWSVVNLNSIFSRPNNSRAGLQLADIGASAFYQALEPDSHGNVNPIFAKALAPRIARKRGNPYGFGLKVMPTWIPSRLPESQREIFRFYER